LSYLLVSLLSSLARARLIRTPNENTASKDNGFSFHTGRSHRQITPADHTGKSHRQKSLDALPKQS